MNVYYTVRARVGKVNRGGCLISKGRGLRGVLEGRLAPAKETPPKLSGAVDSKPEGSGPSQPCAV